MSDEKQEDRKVPEPGEAAHLPDLEATAETVRGGSKWELSELDAAKRLEKPVVENISVKYTT